MTNPEHLSQPSPETHRELRDAVAEHFSEFGENAIFAYPSPKDGQTHFVTFDQALEKSGEHFAHFPAEIVIAMLEGFYDPEASARAQQLRLGRQALSENPGA